MAVWGIKEFEAQGRILIEVERLDPETVLFLDTNSGEYFARGPFSQGQVEGEGYMGIGVMARDGVASWIEEFKARHSWYSPI